MNNTDSLSPDKLSTILSGIAGEYIVAAELSRRGYLASITLRNSKGVDILCFSGDASKSVGIQVKASHGSGRKWILNEKAEDYFADNLFYVFINLNNLSAPDYFIVPSKVVAGFVKEGHHKWLNTPGKRGQKHKDSSIRNFKDSEDRYHNRWDLLGLKASAEPLLPTV